MKDLLKWTKNYCKETNVEYAIIGISGGKDSTVAAAIMAQVLGPEHVIGVSIPNGIQKDMADVDLVFETLGIKRHTINIWGAYKSIKMEVAEEVNMPCNDMVKTNLPARLRMAILYAVAAMYPNSRVVNTCNRSEDYIGWSTKFGDAAGDFSLFANLTVKEVLEIGDELNLPYELVHKAPDDGMCGQTDEDKLGFTYEELDNYLLNGVEGPNLDKIERMHRASRHKFEPMPAFDKNYK